MKRIKRIGITAVIGLIFISTMILAFPKAGATGADVMRKVAGDEAVAKIEDVFYSAKDKVDRASYEIGIKHADAPWQGANENSVTPTSAVADAPAQNTSPTATAIPQWQPKKLKPFTNKVGEGEWQPYLKNARGETVAYRTFLSPDTQRPYVSIGVVAFNLRATRLGFVVGTDEPKSSAKLTRTGKIPDADAKPDRLIAVFNGGFKTQHGQFGVMISNTVLVPPRDGIATIALEEGGATEMGVWGKDPLLTTRTRAWRQNGPAIIRKGQINPMAFDNSVQNWGASIDGAVAVWRSAIGISEDQHALYYAAGDSCLVSVMAEVMREVGAYHAMQLDINNYWVSFSAVKSESGKLIADPLFDSMKRQDPQRYLGAYSRDYFYVVAN